MDSISALKTKLNSVDLPGGLKEKIESTLARLEKVNAHEGLNLEFDRLLNQIDFVLSLPFNQYSTDILDLGHGGSILNKNHFGLLSVKSRILEYLSILILNDRAGRKTPPPVLTFVGLVGSGKTSLAYSVAESLGRKIIRIPFGGLGSVFELRGRSYLSLEGEAGRLMKQIKEAGVSNPVILLDEIDRVAEASRNDVMGVLVELLDPEQNFGFLDYYLDYPFDLSKALFVATANNLTNIPAAVLDRLEIIEMPSYSDEEKKAIGRDYLLPKILEESGLGKEVLIIDEHLWPHIIRPLGYDGGIRSLRRHLQTIVRRVAREVVEGNPGPYNLTVENVGKYLE